LGYAASPAGAQTAPAGGGTGGTADTQVGFQQQINIPLDQQVQVASGHLTYAGKVRETIQKQLQTARQ